MARRLASFSIPLAAICVFLSSSGARAEDAVKSAPELSKYGVQPVAVKLAAGGYMVYFRYKVTDAERAKPLFKDGVKPYVVERASGRKLAMPSDTKLGGLRSSPRTVLAKGKEYYVLFANPAKVVHAGSKIDVVLGNAKFAKLDVK